jgi:nucleoside-diphosphate-sugar epimerase
VPGIYGKGRLPIDRIKSGEPIIKKQESKITNLIHVEDLAGIVIAATASEDLNKCEIINVSDGNPVSSTDYYEIIGMLLGVKITNYVTYEEALNVYTKQRLSFLKESRVLNVNKMFSLFPSCIKYLSLEDGVRASL